MDCRVKPGNDDSGRRATRFPLPPVGRGWGGASPSHSTAGPPHPDPLLTRGRGACAPPLMPPLSSRLRKLYAAAGAKFVDVPVLHPADPFLETAGEDIRRKMFVTDGP